MNKKIKKEPEKTQSNAEKALEETWTYKIGYILGVIIILFLSWLAWEVVETPFGAPNLNFIQFVCLVWLVSLAGRLLFKN